jgi:hypothetical protein
MSTVSMSDHRIVTLGNSVSGCDSAQLAAALQHMAKAVQRMAKADMAPEDG